MKKTRNAWLLLAIAAVVLMVGATHAAIPPIQDGKAVLTSRSSNFDTNPAQQFPFVVGIFDVRDPDCNAPGVGVNWFAPAYHNEMPNPTLNPADEWKVANLGQVFGLTLDAATPPNIYVTSTTAYSGGYAASGRVFKLDGVTGAITNPYLLPNANEGLGNIAYDALKDLFFVTNFSHDAALFGYTIHRLNGSLSAELSRRAPNPGPANPAGGGNRPWGVAVEGDRLYFGVWSTPSSVWSIPLHPGTHDFNGPAVMELQSGTAAWPAISGNPPVSDIDFSPDGHMLIAERGMVALRAPQAHDARVIEFEHSTGAWLPVGSVDKFEIGRNDGPNQIVHGKNATGGVAFSCVGPDSCNQQGPYVVASGDALSGLYYLYGMQILPSTGGTALTSFVVDADSDINGPDKYEMGEVDVQRHCVSCQATDVTVLCEAQSHLTYTVTFNVTNHSGVTAYYLLSPVALPHITPLVPPLPSGQSRQVTYTVSGMPLTSQILHFTLADQTVNECCGFAVQVDFPACDCMQFPDSGTTCDPFVDPPGQFRFNVQNLTPSSVSWLFIFPEPPGAFDILTDDTFSLGNLPQWGIAPAVGTFGFDTDPSFAAGTEVCVRISIHTEDLVECCSTVQCFTVPECSQAQTSSPILVLGESGTMTDTVVSWDPVPAAGGYDVIQGDLDTLTKTAGDFTAATGICIANGQPATSVLVTDIPAPGEGFWFLARSENQAGEGQTYDESTPPQVGLRDAEIAASGVDCP